MVKKIIQKFTIIFALIFVFIPQNTYAVNFELGEFKMTRYPNKLYANGVALTQLNNNRYYYTILSSNENAWGPDIEVGGNLTLTKGDLVRFDMAIYTQADMPEVSHSWVDFTTLESNISSQNITTYSFDTTDLEVKLPCYTTSHNSEYCGEYRGTISELDNAFQANLSNVTLYQYTLRYEGADITTNKIMANSNLWSYYTSTNRIIIIKISSLSVYGSVGTSAQQMEKDKQESQQQGEQSQTNSNQAGGDVQQSTTSILNAITGFFSAFTSARPTNCNMDWGLEDYGFGVINMCQNPIPQEFQVVLSIVSLLFVVPMILWLFNSIINAFKEFQS